MLERVVELFLKVYFPFLTFVFWLFNTLFKEKKVVPCPKDPLLFKSATILSEQIRNRKIKSIEIVDVYIKRIEEVNGIINAIAFKLFDKARNEAKRIDMEIEAMDDEELQGCAVRRPLLGLPFTMKDSFSLKGQIITSGLIDRKDTVCEMTAPAVQRLLDAGAILLAITTVPENCMWIETNTPLYGTTRNPYDSRRIAGGSSGGEGALQGAAGSLMGLGTDICGSVRIPCFMNGIFGLIGTPGTIPLAGHIPEGSEGNYKAEMARVGPMSRFCEDLPMLYKVLTGNNDILKKSTLLENVKVFYGEGLTDYKAIEPYSKETRESLVTAVNHFETKFDKRAECINIPEAKDIFNIYFSSFNDESDDPNAEKMLESPPPTILILIEIIKFFVGFSKFSLPTLVAGIAVKPDKFPVEKREKFAVIRDRVKHRLSDQLGPDGILFFPSWPTLPQFHNETIPKFTSLMNMGLFNIMGMPAIQCPMGLVNGLPNGVMVVGRKGSERLLLDVAQELSNAFGGWVPPGEK